MNVRRAITGDIPEIMTVVKAVVPVMIASGNLQWSDDYPNPEAFERDIQLSQLWIAEVGGKIAGISAITKDQDPEYADADWDMDAPAIVTHRLAVHPAFQGLGIAAILLEQAETVAREEGIKVVRVDTNSENIATQRLFPKLGYRFAGEIGLALRPGLRFYCYEKQLAE